MLALFDLDGTLLEGDSAWLWMEFCQLEGYFEDFEEDFEEQMQRYARAYSQGTFDMQAFMELFLQTIANRHEDEVNAQVEHFIEQCIRPRIYKQSLRLLEEHKNHRRIIISATADFLVRPIAHLLGVRECIGIRCECQNRIFTGQTQGILSFQEGKVQRLRELLGQDYAQLMRHSCFYSDSIHDLFLLEEVKRPVICNGDNYLLAIGAQRGYEIMNLKDD